jgi:hypothetical protein
MNNNTVIILVVVAIAIIGFMMYNASVQAEKDRQMQMQIAAMGNQGGGGTNWLEQLGNLGGIFSTVGGWFGGGSGNTPTTTTGSGTSGGFGGTGGGFGGTGTTDWGLGGRTSQSYSKMMRNDVNSSVVSPYNMAEAKMQLSRQAINDVNAGMSFN